MSWLSQTFSSSLGRKLIMALTGLFLCSFLIIHMTGNLQLFNNDQGLSFNRYAVFMTTFPVIKVVSYLLYASIIGHAIYGLYLTYRNRKARPVQYAQVNKSSSWASRNMAVLGTILLVFIAVHMSGFWYQYKFGKVPYRQYTENLKTGEIVAMEYTGEIKNKMEEYMQDQTTRVTIVKDLYTEVAEAFKILPVVLFYVLAMFAVAYHLIHGFKSAFQSLGLSHPKYNGLINFLGIGVFGILIPIGFAAMPIYFYLKSLM